MSKENVITLEKYFAKCNEVVTNKVEHLKEIYTQSEKAHAESLKLALENSRLETEKIKIESNGYKERFDVRISILEEANSKSDGSNKVIIWLLSFVATFITGTGVAVLVKLFSK